jgi:hypothetical protein
MDSVLVQPLRNRSALPEPKLNLTKLPTVSRLHSLGSGGRWTEEDVIETEEDVIERYRRIVASLKVAAFCDCRPFVQQGAHQIHSDENTSTPVTFASILALGGTRDSSFVIAGDRRERACQKEISVESWSLKNCT